jgi:uncharacterized NAD(P)/FAD-binding protein YdhS
MPFLREFAVLVGGIVAIGAITASVIWVVRQQPQARKNAISLRSRSGTKLTIKRL